MDTNTLNILNAFGLKPKDLEGEDNDIMRIIKPFLEPGEDKKDKESTKNNENNENNEMSDVYKIFGSFFNPKGKESKECEDPKKKGPVPPAKENNSFGLDEEDICPVCGDMAAYFCKCDVGEATCPQGHHWYIDSEGNVMIGSSHYKIPKPVPFKGRYTDNESQEEEREDKIKNLLNSKKYSHIFGSNNNSNNNSDGSNLSSGSNEYLSSVIKTAGESFLNKLKEVDFNKTFSDALSSAIPKPPTATTIETPDLPSFKFKSSQTDASLMEKVRSYRNLENSLFNTMKEMTRLREEISSQSASQQRKFWAAYHDIPYDSEMNDRMDVMVSTLQTLNNNVNSRTEPDVETLRSIIREEMKTLVSETNKTLEDISDNLSILSVRSAK